MNAEQVSRPRASRRLVSISAEYAQALKDYGASPRLQREIADLVDDRATPELGENPTLEGRSRPQQADTARAEEGSQPPSLGIFRASFAYPILEGPAGEDVLAEPPLGGSTEGQKAVDEPDYDEELREIDRVISEIKHHGHVGSMPLDSALGAADNILAGLGGRLQRGEKPPPDIDLSSRVEALEDVRLALGREPGMPAIAWFAVKLAQIAVRADVDRAVRQMAVLMARSSHEGIGIDDLQWIARRLVREWGQDDPRTGRLETAVDLVLEAMREADR